MSNQDQLKLDEEYVSVVPSFRDKHIVQKHATTPEMDEIKREPFEVEFLKCIPHCIVHRSNVIRSNAVQYSSRCLASDYMRFLGLLLFSII